ncbi:hypothetical protein T484DRAFT_2376152 [Baffinella frigidus]|nr:hypothetical protein T484DRAFT_2376152 [Cryptophyta sp. CCMP2293]
MNGWDEWRLFREDSVGRCFSITDPDTVCASAREEAGRTGEDVCRDEMYPSEVHSFEHHVPVNNKWIPKFPIYDRNTIQDPEHLLDIVYDYHFYHDQSIREADSVFTAGRPSAGDVVFDQVENVSRVSFFAASLG